PQQFSLPAVYTRSTNLQHVQIRYGRSKQWTCFISPASSPSGLPLPEPGRRLQEARAIVNELRKYDEALYEKPRWLVLNKLDMVPDDERKARVADFIKRYEWDGPVFEISALTGQGCEGLTYAIFDYISKNSDASRAAEAEDLAADVRFRDEPAVAAPQPAPEIDEDEDENEA
ncbi:hypothetical protein ACRXB1_36390, partial [Caballeronia sp. M23-90]